MFRLNNRSSFPEDPSFHTLLNLTEYTEEQLEKEDTTHAHRLQITVETVTPIRMIVSIGYRSLFGYDQR